MPDLHFTLSQILAQEKPFRRNLINCLSGFKSLNVCSTISPSGHTNLALLNSVIHVGANPPLMGMLMRPHTVPRHTIENIEAMGVYTLNMVSQAIYQEAHQASARYPQEVSEFEATGLSPWYSNSLKAPYVAESPVKIGLRFEEKHLIAANDTQLIVGKIEELFLPEAALGEDGFLNLSQLGAVAGNGLDGYHLGQPLTRLSYAKPDQTIDEIPFDQSNRRE